ncbi:hypothetical protein, partial [Acidovorax sp. HMWF029]|uniref:hypothetical protein n=1 Tax=Acidovorax sp. HMWF029 TaxID=2056863 RepID=UPI001E4A781A
MEKKTRLVRVFLCLRAGWKPWHGLQRKGLDPGALLLLWWMGLVGCLQRRTNLRETCQSKKGRSPARDSGLIHAFALHDRPAQAGWNYMALNSPEG